MTLWASQYPMWNICSIFMTLIFNVECSFPLEINLHWENVHSNILLGWILCLSNTLIILNLWWTFKFMDCLITRSRMQLEQGQWWKQMLKVKKCVNLVDFKTNMNPFLRQTREKTLEALELKNRPKEFFWGKLGDLRCGWKQSFSHHVWKLQAPSLNSQQQVH